MPACGTCNKTILFGGTKYAGRTYCNARCANAAAQQEVAQRDIPPQILAQEIADVHDGPCPRCKKERRVDLYKAHWVWSVIILTRFSTSSVLCCRACGRKHQVYQSLFSLFLGWWGFPFGLIITPIQIIRNIVEFAKPESVNPSAELASAVQASLAQQLMAAGFLAQTAPAETPANQPADAPVKLTDAARTSRNTNVVDLVEPERVHR